VLDPCWCSRRQVSIFGRERTAPIRGKISDKASERTRVLSISNHLTAGPFMLQHASATLWRALVRAALAERSRSALTRLSEALMRISRVCRSFSETDGGEIARTVRALFESMSSVA